MIFDIKNDTDVALLRAAIKGQKVGLTSGSFDLFHHMHLVYLMRCRRLCEVLVVGVDSNDLVCLRKGEERPLVPEHQRVALVGALSCVHAAFIMGSVEDFEIAVNQLDVKVIFKNQHFEGKDVLGKDKAQVVIIKDITQHASTTQIIEEIRNRRDSNAQ